MKPIKVQKARQITEAQIQFVSLVDKAANKRSFLVTKAEDGKATFESYGRIVKVDADTHYVTGIVYEPMTEDSQGDFMAEADIRKAAHWFAKNGDKVDIQHSFEVADGVYVVENYIAPQELDFDGVKVAKGTWLITTEINNNDIWKAVQDESITGYSMGGYAQYSDEEVDLNKSDRTDEHKGILKSIAEALGFKVSIEKGAVQEAYDSEQATREKDELLWNAYRSLESVVQPQDKETGMRSFITDADAIDEALSDFKNIVTGILTGNTPTKQTSTDTVEQTEKKEVEKMDNNKLIELMEEKITSALKDAFKAVSDAVANGDAEGNETSESNNEAAQGGDTGAEGAVTKEALAAMIDEAVAKAMNADDTQSTDAQLDMDAVEKAATAAAETVLKARNIPTNLNNEPDTQKSGDHYLKGII